jgi:hypothetical protein
MVAETVPPVSPSLDMLVFIIELVIGSEMINVLVVGMFACPLNTELMVMAYVPAEIKFRFCVVGPSDHE